LTVRFSQLCPFEFGDDHVFNTCYEKTKPLQVDGPATAELLPTEGARLAEDQVNLPPGSEVNYIEQRLLPLSLKGRI
jgi:hypothetical protein